jgi:hypothetical protein
MRRVKNLRHTIAVTIALALTSAPATVSATTPQLAAPAGLSVLEVKMTGDEFIVLQNNTGGIIADLSTYWLSAYNNVSPVAAGVSSSSEQLPAASLPAGQMLLLSANPMQTCGASVAGKLSLSLSDGGGFLELTQTGIDAHGALAQTPIDWLSWSSGAAGAITSVPSGSKSPNTVYFRYLSGSGYVWQQAAMDVRNDCQLNFVVAGGSEPSSAVTPLTLAATSPPATILGNLPGDGSSTPVMPPGDAGLQAPQLSELLPNPSGTGNDSTDEFIELYNPNDVPFDLTGFSLQAGLTTLHLYTFPAGTMLPAKSFKAFYSAETGLSLSNTASQVGLLDPSGKVIGITEPYSKAKDGQTWALAKGKWYWTLQPTPNKANVVRQPGVKVTSTKKKAARTVTKTGTSMATAGPSEAVDDADKEVLVHPWVLALVALGALLYGAYEYRRDLANRLFQLRGKLGVRRADRQATTGRRGD